MVLAIWQVPSRKDSRGLSLLDGIYYGEWVIARQELSPHPFLSDLRIKSIPEGGVMSMVGRKGTIITVFSTAYAVGKTLIAINMAAELAMNRHTVCLIDLDLQFGDAASALKLTPKKTIADAEKSMREHPDDTVAAEYLTSFSSGDVSFDVMANPKLLEEAYNLDTTLIRDLVVQLQLEYDYLIIDTTSTFSALNLSLMDLSTVIDFIGIVDFIPTIKNMKRGSDALKELGYDDNKIRYVLNRSNARTRINVKDVEAILGHQFHYVIPNDFQTAAESIKTGVPLVLSAKDTPLAKGIRTMVDTYEEDTASPQKSQEGGWLSRLFS